MKISAKVPQWLKTLNSAINPSQLEIERMEAWLFRNSPSHPEVNESIAWLVEGSRAGFVGRPGGTESVGLEHFIRNRLVPRQSKLKKRYPAFFQSNAAPFSGIATKSPQDFDHFCYLYLQAAMASDIFGFGAFASGSLGIASTRAKIGLPIARIAHLEPWELLGSRHSPWTLALSGKRVLVIHPFVDTIRSQYVRRSEISGVREILPEFELLQFRPPRTLSNSAAEGSWLENWERMKGEISAIAFDVAIVGAGSYGLPISHFISSQGRKAIHMGGTTQLLFGIRGNRWDSGHAVSRFIDESWVSVSELDKFPGLNQIEGGSYS